MLKTLAILPLVTALIGAIGFAACRAAGASWHPHEMVWAGIIALIASSLACVPGILTRGMDAGAVSQAALGGTVVQMLLMVALSPLLWIFHIRMEPAPLVWWLMSFYWGTLVTLVIGMMRCIRAAAQSTSSKQ